MDTEKKTESFTNRIVKLSGDRKARVGTGRVYADSKREGPYWLREIYDAPQRVVLGAFGRVK